MRNYYSAIIFYFNIPSEYTTITLLCPLLPLNTSLLTFGEQYIIITKSCLYYTQRVGIWFLQEITRIVFWPSLTETLYSARLLHAEKYKRTKNGIDLNFSAKQNIVYWMPTRNIIRCVPTYNMCLDHPGPKNTIRRLSY